MPLYERLLKADSFLDGPGTGPRDGDCYSEDVVPASMAARCSVSSRRQRVEAGKYLESGFLIQSGSQPVLTRTRWRFLPGKHWDLALLRSEQSPRKARSGIRARGFSEFQRWKALINRLGFNNEGVEKIAARLEQLRRSSALAKNSGRDQYWKVQNCPAGGSSRRLPSIVSSFARVGRLFRSQCEFTEHARFAQVAGESSDR